MERRDFFKTAAAVAGTAALGSSSVEASATHLPVDNRKVNSVNFPQKRPMIVYSDRPPLLESPRSVFTSALTPNDLFFVRWHMPDIPTYIDEKKFKITVDGVFDPESYILTFDRILRPSFWSKVFNLPCRPDPDGIQSGMLRESLGRNWGMDLNESQNKTPNVIIDFLFNRLMTLKQKKIIANFFKI